MILFYHYNISNILEALFLPSLSGVLGVLDVPQSVKCLQNEIRSWYFLTLYNMSSKNVCLDRKFRLKIFYNVKAEYAKGRAIFTHPPE